jgi:translocation and assembly module TamB
MQASQLTDIAAQFAGGGDGALDYMCRSLSVDGLDLGVELDGGPLVGTYATRLVKRRISDARSRDR